MCFRFHSSLQLPPSWIVGAPGHLPHLHLAQKGRILIVKSKHSRVRGFLMEFCGLIGQSAQAGCIVAMCTCWAVARVLRLWRTIVAVPDVRRFMRLAWHHDRSCRWEGCIAGGPCHCPHAATTYPSPFNDMQTCIATLIPTWPLDTFTFVS